MDTSARVARQRSYFAQKGTPGLLVFISETPPRSDVPPYSGLMARVNRYVDAHQGRLPDEEQIDAIVAEVVSEFRALWRWRCARIPDDTIPIVGVHFDIGVQTAAMTGLEPAFLVDHWWLEPNLDWHEIDRLAFDPKNRWVQMFLALNRSLWRHWQEDYFFLPFWHRSPLDAHLPRSRRTSRAGEPGALSPRGPLYAPGRMFPGRDRDRSGRAAGSGATGHIRGGRYAIQGASQDRLAAHRAQLLLGSISPAARPGNGHVQATLGDA